MRHHNVPNDRTLGPSAGGEAHEAAAAEACSFCGREGLQAAKGRPTAEVDHHPDSGFSRSFLDPSVPKKHNDVKFT